MTAKMGAPHCEYLTERNERKVEISLTHDLKCKCFEVGPSWNEMDMWPCFCARKELVLQWLVVMCTGNLQIEIKRGLVDSGYCLCRLNSQPLWLPHIRKKQEDEKGPRSHV